MKASELIKSLKTHDPDTVLWYVEERVGSLAGLDYFIEDQRYEDREATDAELDELRNLMSAILARAEFLPGRVLRNILRDTRKECVAPVAWADPDDPVYVDTTPRWPTGCDAIDEITGGGYGMVILAGAPKVGKSLLACSSSVEAAKAGWQVIYGNAEMSPDHILVRFRNYMKTVDREVAKNLHIANLGPGIGINKFYEEVRDNALSNHTEKLLIVLDSLNRVVDFGASSESNDSGYWKTLADWSAWAMNSRRTSEARISWLLVSELNSQGVVKGRNLEYTADMVIRVKATSIDDIVDIDVPYSRATRAAEVGAAFRDFPNGRFEVGA